MKKVCFLVAVAALLSACGNGKIKIGTDSLVMHHAEQARIVAESKLPISYESENRFNATVDDSGVVTARCVGETRIRVSTDDDVRFVSVDVRPLHNLFTVPDIAFGESRESVVSKYGQPDQVTSGGVLVYNDYCMIGFKLMVTLSDGAVSSYAVAVPSAFSSQLSDFLAERYVSVGAEDGVVYMVDGVSPESASLFILVTYSSGYYVVLYTPVGSGKGLACLPGCDPSLWLNVLYK